MVAREAAGIILRASERVKETDRLAVASGGYNSPGASAPDEFVREEHDMRDRPGFRLGAVAGYLIISLLGGIIGGLVVGWTMQRAGTGSPAVTSALPYTDAARPASTQTAADTANS